MIELVSELRSIDEALRETARYASDYAYGSTLNTLLTNIKKVEDAWYGSCIGYLANVYCIDFEAPTLDMHRSLDWDSETIANSETGTNSSWRKYSDTQVNRAIEHGIERGDIRNVFDHTLNWIEGFEEKKADILAIIRIAQEKYSPMFDQFAMSTEQLQILTLQEQIDNMKPAVLESDDAVANHHVIRVPPHIRYHAKVMWSMGAAAKVRKLRKLVERIIAQLERVQVTKSVPQVTGNKIFIGHGTSHLWRALKDYIADDLKLPWDEFERTYPVGTTITERLKEMLDDAAIALLLMTADDEQIDGKFQARMNVIHEIGLFQGRLGFDKAIILLEDGCEEFSNKHGLIHIPFPQQNIKAAFHDIYKQLEKHNLLRS